MADLLLGIDIGTTGTKAVLLDASAGRVVASASRPAALHTPGPGIAEADTADWWGNICELVPELLRIAGADNGAIATVAASGMVPAVVPLDRAGTPLRRAILQNDARAGKEIDELSEQLRALDLVALTGSALTQQSVAPTVVWLRRHEPRVLASLGTLAGSYDWAARALGARPHVEQNWAIESGLFDLDGQVLDPVVSAAGIEPEWLPEVVAPGQIVGEVSGGAAEETGLRAGTPIVVGGADHVLSAYSAGLSRPGDWLVKLGGAGDILVTTDQAFTDPHLYLDAHPVPDLWLPNGCMATSGSLIRWFQSLVGGAPLAELDDEAQERAPGAILCLPYFLGEKSPLHDPNLRGAFVGLHLGHDRAALYRAVLEAVAFGFRHHLEVLADRGVALDQARVSNGGAASQLWKQIHADVLGVTLHPVLDHPGASLGAAQVAGVGVGLLEDWGVVVDHVTLGEAVEPDESLAAFYAERYQLWRELGDALTPYSHHLATRGSP